MSRPIEQASVMLVGGQFAGFVQDGTLHVACGHPPRGRVVCHDGQEFSTYAATEEQARKQLEAGDIRVNENVRAVMKRLCVSGCAVDRCPRPDFAGGAVDNRVAPGK